MSASRIAEYFASPTSCHVESRHISPQESERLHASLVSCIQGIDKVLSCNERAEAAEQSQSQRNNEGLENVEKGLWYHDMQAYLREGTRKAFDVMYWRR